MSVTPWVGAPTDSSFKVRAKVTTGTSFRLAVSTSPTLTSPVYFGPVSPTLSVVTLTASDLTPFTTYHYALEVDGVLDTASQGRARTAPTPGEPTSFVAAQWGCAGSRPAIDGGYPISVNGQTGISASPVYTTIADTDPAFMVINGDRHYRNPTSTDPAQQRANYDDVLTVPVQAYAHRMVPSLYVWDDHDMGADNADKTATARAASATVYRERVPHLTLPASDGIGVWHSMVYGRVRVVVTDQRSQRDIRTNADNSSKRMLGAEQEAWFYDELRAAKSAGQIVWWVCETPWAGATTANQDDWRGYNTERQRIANTITSLGMAGRMFAVVGDTHGMAIDDGSNNLFGGFPIFTAAALDGSVGVPRGGPFSAGAVTTAPGQWGLVDIEDTGGDEITVTFRGMTADTETVGYSVAMSVNPNSGVRASDGRGLYVYNYGGVPVRLPS